MTKLLFIVICGLLAIQLVSSQPSRTTWSAAMRPGLGGMTTVPPDFTDYQNSMAIANIHGAKTENQAAYAAATVFHPARDMADNVQQALESKVRQLRGANGVFVPFNFDVMHLVMGAYHRTLDPNAAQSTGPNAGPMGPGPAMGPPTAIRRGARPGSGPGNARSNFRNNRNSRPASWQVRGQGTNNFGGWNNARVGQGQGQNQMPGNNNAAQTVPDFTPLASEMPGWINPFYNANSNPSWWKK